MSNNRFYTESILTRPSVEYLASKYGNMLLLCMGVKRGLSH